MASKKTLLQKYGIPVERLDFVYINSTKNVKELEKIVQILRSGEEGYFPDLTDTAVEKLRELNPNSKYLRTEVKILTKDGMTKKEWNAINDEFSDWESVIKNRNKKLQELDRDRDGLKNIPPIRQNCKVDKISSQSGKNKSRIKSCDYESWNKYDPDAEILKIEFDEERNREISQKNIKDELKVPNLIEEIFDDSSIKLSDTEIEIFADQHRIKGNEHFKAKEYKDALEEYTKSVKLKKSPAAYNNRAITYLKLKLPKDAIGECDKCLQLDPNNVKALLRKAQALSDCNKKRESFYVYQNILRIDSDNEIAKKFTQNLKEEFGEFAAENSTRMKIVEFNETDDEPVKKIDFAKLIIPNKISENKLKKMASTYTGIVNDQKKKMMAGNSRINRSEPCDMQLLTSPISTNCNGSFIEEITE